MWPRSRLSMKKYRVSSNSPLEICKQRRSSFVVRLPNPSAIFAATEAAARLTCDTIPNCSDRGNFSVNLYVSSTNSCALCHTVRSEKRLIFTVLSASDTYHKSPDYPADAAPLTTSIISRVIAAWRTLFMCSVSASITSEALLVADSIAVMRAACSAAEVSANMR
jgi:hypothetical protein